MNTLIITKTQKARIRNYLCIVFIMIIIALLAGLILAKNSEVLTTASVSVAKKAGLFRLIRWVIIGTLLVLWPYLVEGLGNKMAASAAQKSYWKSEILYIAMWLILFELLICENIIFKLVHLA